MLTPAASTRRERGAAMVTVVVLVTVCFTVAMGVAAVSIAGTGQTVTDRSRLQALSAAEAGRDVLLAQLQSSPTSCPATRTAAGNVGTATYSATASWAATTTGASGSTCTANGTIRITAVGTAADGTTKTIVASYPFAAGVQATSTVTVSAPVTVTSTPIVTTTVSTAPGAIIQGSVAGSSLNLPSVVINDGDLLIASSGTFDCNSNSIIDGDLVVPNGSVSLSNQCRVGGSIYAKGDVVLNNLGNTVGGSIASTTGDVSINNGSVAGGISAGGKVSLQNGVTVGGNVVAAGKAASYVYNAVLKGNVSVGGNFSGFQATTVTGSVTAAGTATSSVAPDTTIGGNLTLGGAIDTWNAGPTVKGTKTYNKTGLPAPTISTPSALGRSTWLEVPWKSSAWTAAGWSVQTATASQCDYANTPALVSAVNALTAPTVIDATACGAGGLNLYNVTLSLKTHVAFVAQAFRSAQSLTVNAAGGGTRIFDLIVPDPNSGDGAPTCPSGAQSSSIYHATLADGVFGLAYSPCTLQFGTASWNGQIIAGYPDPAGGAITLDYAAVAVPGATSPGGTSGTATLTATGSPTTSVTMRPTASTVVTTTSPSMTPTLVQQTEP